MMSEEQDWDKAAADTQGVTMYSRGKRKFLPDLSDDEDQPPGSSAVEIMPGSLEGVEGETLQLIFNASTPPQWAELLRTPFERALEQGNREFALKLVAAKAQVENVLHDAVFREDEELVNGLLRSRASLIDKEDYLGRTPLHVAADWNLTAMVEMLLEKGADTDVLDKDDMTPLSLAVSKGQLDVALALMAAGADINLLCGKNFRSVVHIAVKKGDIRILRAVIEHGANVDVRDIRTKDAPLHLAALDDNAEAVDALVKAGADKEIRNGCGLTPVHEAANTLGTDALLVLLKLGGDINALDGHEKTLLYSAAFMAGRPRKAEMVDLLLWAGADETFVDDDGRAAMDVIGKWFDESEEEPFLPDVERVRRLFSIENRAWRRRRYVVMCRTFRDEPDRMKLAHNSDVNWVARLSELLDVVKEGIFRKVVGYL